jgi:hypothetical protein
MSDGNPGFPCFVVVRSVDAVYSQPDAKLPPNTPLAAVGMPAKGELKVFVRRRTGRPWPISEISSLVANTFGSVGLALTRIYSGVSDLRAQTSGRQPTNWCRPALTSELGPVGPNAHLIALHLSTYYAWLRIIRTWCHIPFDFESLQPAR